MTRVMKKDLKEIEKKPLKEQIEIRKKLWMNHYLICLDIIKYL